jgi:dTDP-4-amino-4,6-dideoxygalactose transaminase
MGGSGMLVTGLFPDMQQVARRLLARGVDSKYHYMRDCSLLLDGIPSFECAAQAEEQVLHLPAYPELSNRQIDFVATEVRQVVGEMGAG